MYFRRDAANEVIVETCVNTMPILLSTLVMVPVLRSEHAAIYWVWRYHIWYVIQRVW